MPLPEGYSRLAYRGYFDVEIGFDHKESQVSAPLGGGYLETEVIFPKLRTCALNYPAPTGLHRDALIEVEPGVFKNRLEYIVDIYNTSKENGNEPVLMKFPYDGKWYLWRFPDDDLTVRLIDLYMASGGLKLRQAYVAGVVPDNLDGSFDDDGS